MSDQKQNTCQRQILNLVGFEKSYNLPFKYTLLPMLCFIESLALAWTCKTFLKYKPDFHKAFDEFIEEKGIRPERIRYTMQHGLAVTGSTLHQILFGVRYPGSDIDTLEMGKLEDSGVQVDEIRKLSRDNICLSLMPRPEELKGKTLMSWNEDDKENVISIQVINPQVLGSNNVDWMLTPSENIDYDKIVPVMGFKYILFRPEEAELHDTLSTEQRFEIDGLDAVTEEIKKSNLTSIETIYINPKICQSSLQFIDRFCDISFCKLLYNGKLKIKHLDHLFTRKFEVFWDTSRYAWRDTSSEFHLHANDLSEKVARHKIEGRLKKYKERGFTCLNPNSRKNL